MDIQRATVQTCSQADDTVVVIDVLRAFTTAAYAFAAGAQAILPVSTVEEALALRQRIPNALIMGEVHGKPVDCFDFGNSPAAMIGRNLSGRTLIQRTSAGTQGVVGSRQADSILTASFCCAAATARYVQRRSPKTLTFVITGLIPPDGGDEDVACADYLEALMRGQQPDVTPFIQRVRQSTEGRLFGDPGWPQYPASDLECCTDVDRFDFAMHVVRKEGQLVMEAVTDKTP